MSRAAPRLAPRPGAGVRGDGRLSDLWAYRELLWTFVVREVRIRYTQAALGAAWAVLQPVALMAAFTVFFAWFLRVPSDGMPYPLFAFSGLLPWTFLATAIGSGVPSLTNNASLVGKVAFPREILPLAAILAAGADFLIAAAAFFGLEALYGTRPTVALAYLPLLLAVQLALVAGVVLPLAALNVAYRDVRYALPLLLQLWMFATPVIYPVSVVPERLRLWYLLNPMSGLIDAYRSVLLRGQAPDAVALALATAVSALLCVAGYRYFKRVEGEFADII